MKECGIKFNLSNAGAFKALYDYCGTNQSLFYDYFISVVETMDSNEEYVFTKDFIDKWDSSEPLDSKTTDPELLKNKIIKYYNDKYPSVTDSQRKSRDYNPTELFKYVNSDARREAIETFSNHIVSGYFNKVTRSKDINARLVAQSCVDYAVGFIKSNIAKKVSQLTGIDFNTLFKSTDVDYRKLLLNNKAPINTQLQNLLALWEELQTKTIKGSDVNPAENFIEECKINPRVNSLPIFKDAVLTTDEERLKTLDSSDLGNSQNVENDVDLYINALSNKIGETSDFYTAMDVDVRSVLSQLYTMKFPEDVNGDAIYDTDTYLGIPKMMDPRRICAVLYSYGGFFDSDEMLSSIKSISENIPGMAGLSKLVDVLNNNEDIKIKMFRMFKKASVSKSAITIQNNEGNPTVLNIGLNKEVNLITSYVDQLSYTSVFVDLINKRTELSKLKELVNKYDWSLDRNGSEIRGYCNDLFNIVKTMLPRIDERTIKNYILNETIDDKVPNTKANATKLINTITLVLDEMAIIKSNHDNMISEVQLAKFKNKAIYKDMDAELKGVTDPNEIDKIKRKYSKLLINVSDIYKTGYMTEQTETKNIKNLAKLLCPYTYQDINHNTRNVENKQVSSIINNSMMTTIDEIIHSPLNKWTEEKDSEGNVVKRKMSDTAPILQLKEWFKYKQYDFNNLLLEHKDENNNIINKGLFREVTTADGAKDYEVTEYFDSILTTELFDGINNEDSGESAKYAKMLKADFFGTAWRFFFKQNSKYQTGTRYFTRIPSDAPKIFDIVAPTYSAKGLLDIVNRKELQAENDAFVNKLNAFADYYSVVNPKYPIITFKNDVLFSHLNAIAEKPINIKIPINRQKNFKDNASNKILIAFRYSTEFNDRNTENVYVMEGIYDDGMLKNARFVGALPNQGNVLDSLSSSFTEETVSAIKKLWWEDRSKRLSTEEGSIQWSVSENHPIYKQIENTFIQELTDMATAINVMFETERDANGNYRIKTDDFGEPVIKHSPVCKSNTEHDGLYEVYHFRGKNIYEKDKFGNFKATGRVFESDKFSMYDFAGGTDTIVNYGKALMDNYFKLFKNATTDSEFILQFDANGDIVLTDSQRSAIKDNMKEFILKYIQQSMTRSRQFENTIINESFQNTTENNAEFILNYHLMWNNFDALYEGNSKFYKDSQAFLKRAKEGQGSGVKYFYNTPRGSKSEHIQCKSPSDNVTFTRKYIENGEAKTEEFKIPMYNSFSAITIKNTVNTDEKTLNNIVSTLANESIMGENVMDKEDALELLYGKIDGVDENGKPIRKGGYQEITTNDAQSYITFNEWVRRIAARGQLNKHLKLINRILDETKPLRVSDIKQFVQIQKNFYYDQFMNDGCRVRSPRQIKNSEKVLIDRLVKGTELELVKKAMDVLGIDQINTKETSKAGNSKIFKIWDNAGHFDKDLIHDLSQIEKGKKEAYTSDILRNGNTYAQYYDYNYLYTQLEAPQHMNEENKVGVQVIKKIVDNVDDNSSQHLQEARDEFFKVYSASIKCSARDVIKELGKNKNGQLEISKAKVYNRIKRELIRTGITKNLCYCCEVDELSQNEDSKIPSWMTTDNFKFQNIVASIFNNNITRQTLPGFHAGQITALGYRKLADKSTTKVNSTLQYHPMMWKKDDVIISQREYERLSSEDRKGFKQNGIAPWIEVLLPAENFGIDRNSPRYKDKTKEEQDELILKDLQEAGVDEIIGYRIPTEGKQSIAVMKVAGFLDEAEGSSIVVPDLWVGQTGSDFDADSIYGIQYPSLTDKDGKPYQVHYKEDESPENQSKHARDTRILDCLKTILKDPASYEEGFGRSNCDYLQDSVNVLASATTKKIRKSRTPYNFHDQAEYQNEAMSGATLKAFSVSRDSFCSISNRVHAEFRDFGISVKYDSSKYSFEELKKHFPNVTETSDGNYLVTHYMLGWSNDNRNADGKFITTYSSQTTAYILDAIKLGSLPNVNETTFGIFKSIVDLGCTYDIAVAFIQQPAITKLIEVYGNNESRYSTNKKPKLIDVARQIATEMNVEVEWFDTISDIQDKIAASYGLKTPNKEFVLDYEQMVDRLNANDSAEGAIYDLSVLKMYDNLQRLTDEIKSVSRCITADKFGAESNIFDNREILYNILVSDSPIVDAIYPHLSQLREFIFNSPEPIRQTVAIELLVNTIDNDDNFVKDSKYQYMAAFVKHATCLAYKVNTQIFEEERIGAIPDTIYSSPLLSSTGGILSREQYFDIKDYIINTVRRDCSFVINPLKYSLKSGRGRGFVHKQNKHDLADSEIRDEFNRIYGFNKTNKVDIVIKDLNNPTQEELDEFCKLSPAQKVAFVQTHFRDLGIFDHISYNLNNTYKTHNTLPGQHVLRYNDVGEDLDYVRDLFEDAFCNKNPLIACTAADILKYAIVCEQFTIGMKNVSKLIPNSILISDSNIIGTGIADEMKEAINDINPSLVDSYVRSTGNLIKSHNVFKTKSGYELVRNSHGIIHIPFYDKGFSSSSPNKLLTKYSIISNDEISTYVKLTFGKDTDIYRIDVRDSNVYLYPTNPLNAGESGEYSFDSSNWKYPSMQEYEAMIDEYTKVYHNTYDDAYMRNIFKELNIELKSENIIINKDKELPDLNNNNSFIELLSRVNNWYDNRIQNATPVLFTEYNPLDNYISDNDIHPAQIALNDGRIVTIGIQRVDMRTFAYKYTGKNINRTIDYIDAPYKTLIDGIRRIASRNVEKTVSPSFKSMYAIHPIYNKEEVETPNEEDNISFSTHYDVVSQAITSTFNRNWSDADDFVGKYIPNWKLNHVTSIKDVLENNPKMLEDAERDVAHYLKEITDQIIYKMYHYEKDEDGNWLAVNDVKCIDIIKKDPIKKSEYLKFIQEPARLAEEYGLIHSLNVESRDPVVDEQLKIHKECIDKMVNLPIIADAYEKFAQNYFDKLTEHPLIKKGYRSVLDGYNKTNWLNAMFNDIQETSNPLIQAVMKDFKSNLAARDFQGKENAKIFIARIKEIEEEAKKHGKTVLLSNIITEYGTMVLPYTEELRKTKKELYDKVLSAKAKGENSVEHLRAKLEYDEWYARHFEQPVEYSYYKQKYELTDSILNPNIDKEIEKIYGENAPAQAQYELDYFNKLPALYSEYKKITSERAKLYNKYATDENNPEYVEAMSKLDERYLALFGYRRSTESEDDFNARMELKNRINKLRALEKKYFIFKAKPGFEERLAENKRIIDSFELSGLPSTLYSNNSEYIKAKKWMAKNVFIEPLDEEWNTINEKLSLFNSTIGDIEAESLYKKVLHNREYRNAAGDFDPRLVPENVIKQLRDAEYSKYKHDEKVFCSDKSLISNKELDDNVYTKEFYDNLRSGVKEDQIEWFKAITKINNILSPLYNNNRQEISFEELPTSESKLIAMYGKEFIDYIIDTYVEEYKNESSNPDEVLDSTNGYEIATGVLLELRKLYNVLENIRKAGPKSESVRKFMSEKCTITISPKYNRDREYLTMLDKGKLKNALLNVITTYDTYTETLVPNTFIYSSIKPIGADHVNIDDFDVKNGEAVAKAGVTLNPYINYKATLGAKLHNKYIEQKLRNEYLDEKLKMSSKSKEEYREWYENNHVYNPYRRAYEPIHIWWENQYKFDKYQYVPKYNESEKEVRKGYLTHEEAVRDLQRYESEEFPDANTLENHYFAELDHTNEKFKDKCSCYLNYRRGSGFDTEVKANEYELEIAKEIQMSLLKVARTKADKNFIENGGLPAERKSEPQSAKGWMKEIFKTLGYYSEPYDPDDWKENISYAEDEVKLMPMLEKLKGKGYKDMPKYPIRRKNETEEEFSKRLLEYETKSEEIRKNNLEIHKSMLNDDWINVISDFIVQGNRYNAIQENKYELFYALEMLKKYGHYISKWNKYGEKHLVQKYSDKTEDSKAYDRTPDKHLIEQFKNQIRREVYNQFKENNSPKLMKVMQTLQSLTSAQMMMLNVKGGIANVTVGETQIKGEAFAKEFFDMKTLYQAKLKYASNIFDYIIHAYDDKSSSVEGALIKKMIVLDYDEINGVTDSTRDAYAVLKHIRNAGYSTQSSGEHAMQNTALIAMTLSHRVFLNPRRDEFGQPKYIVKNLAEHKRDSHEQALLSILSDEERDMYNRFKEGILQDADKFNDYALFKKDFATEFSRAILSVDKRREFVNKRIEMDKELENEFNDDAEHPTLFSQFELKDGELAIKPDSKLFEMENDVDSAGVKQTYRLLADFRHRVISVNKYIHGSYDKSGRAQFERYACGSLFTQFHKHLPIGIMKRYRNEGMYSEERGSVSRGMYQSLIDFIKIPFNKHKDILRLNDEQLNACLATQNIFKNILDFCVHAKLAYRELPDYERANLRRMQGDVYGTLLAIALMILVRCVGDDDDDSVLYNLALYECDRLASETAEYSFGAFSESKKLLTQPSASMSFVTDMASSANMLAHMILEGDEFDGEYHSGKFAGENKLKVYLERRIPLWRGIKSSFIDITKTNKYYKYGENVLDLFNVKELADDIKK